MTGVDRHVSLRARNGRSGLPGQPTRAPQPYGFTHMRTHSTLTLKVSLVHHLASQSIPVCSAMFSDDSRLLSGLLGQGVDQLCTAWLAGRHAVTPPSSTVEVMMVSRDPGQPDP